MAELGDTENQLYHIAYEGTITDEDRYAVLGGDAETIAERMGAAWQAEVFHRLYDDKGLDRTAALREMTQRYREHMHSNQPVHDWPVD